MDDLVTMMYEQTVLIAERPSEFDLRIGDRVYGKYNNYWEHIVNEQHEKCSKAAKFDPCKELKVEGLVEEDASSTSSSGGGEVDVGSAAASGGDDEDGDD